MSKPPPAAGRRAPAGRGRGWLVRFDGLYRVSALACLPSGGRSERAFCVHPLVVFFVLAGLSLLALRMALARPVPEVIPDRTLMLGCVLGLAMFLAGNFVAARLLPLS